MEKLQKPAASTKKNQRIEHAKSKVESQEGELSSQINNSPAITAQRKKLNNMFGSSTQRVEKVFALQEKIDPIQKIKWPFGKSSNGYKPIPEDSTQQEEEKLPTSTLSFREGPQHETEAGNIVLSSSQVGDNNSSESDSLLIESNDAKKKLKKGGQIVAEQAVGVSITGAGAVIKGVKAARNVYNTNEVKKNLEREANNLGVSDDELFALMLAGKVTKLKSKKQAAELMIPRWLTNGIFKQRGNKEIAVSAACMIVEYPTLEGKVVKIILKNDRTKIDKYLQYKKLSGNEAAKYLAKHMGGFGGSYKNMPDG